MSRIVKVSESNYRLVVQTGGTITLDTGYNPEVDGAIPQPADTVVITGNLLVLGETTTVNTTDLNIEDNVIRLNVGETGAGVTEGTSGIQIDRGSLPDVEFIWDENVTHYNPLTSSNVDGTFVFKNTSGILQGIQTTSIATGGTTNLIFDLKNSNNVIRIANNNATSYADRLLADLNSTDDDNDIPNRKFVTKYIQSGVVVPGMADVDRIYYAVGGVEKTRAQALLSSIQFAVNQSQRAQITANGLDVDYVNVFGSTITGTNGSYNLILTAANNNVELNAVLNLDDQSAAPSVPSGKTKVYSKSVSGSGRTGLYISNTSLTNIQTWDSATSSYATGRDELVVKNRALLFSMIF